MFRMVLLTQWKWSRLAVLAGVFAAFTFPILSVQRAGVFSGSTREAPGHAQQLLDAVQSWSIAYPMLAAGLALFVAVTAWGADHRGRHVYALSLPLPRWHYVLLRFGAGALLLLGPVVALGLGSFLASAASSLPAGLHSYPLALTLRFGLAVLVAYALMFSISAGTTRTATFVLSAIMLLVVVQVIATALNAPVNLFEFAGDRLFTTGSPFQVFTGRWMLIDV